MTQGLKAILDEIQRQMDEKDAVRELALKSTRAIARLSGLAIRGLHRGEDITGLLRDAREEASRLRSVLEGHPDIEFAGFVEGAHQELCEAALSHALLHGTPLPSPRDLGVAPTSYLLGLGDVVGELRRFALDRLKVGDVEGANRFLEAMEEIYDELMRFDYPTALVAIKRKQDIARGLLEKTRGEVVVAVREAELQKRLDALRGRL